MIWVTGCNGLLGSEVVMCLEKTKLPFIATDLEVDITDYLVLEKFANDKFNNNLSFIINCAGYTNVDKAETEPELVKKLNTDGPGNLAKIAKKTGAILIHISTDYVFDGKDTSPISEENIPNPINIYGRTKAAGDKLIQETLEKYYILRTSWLYGAGGKNFVTTMINIMNSKDSIKVVNDQTGSPTYAVDLAEVIVKIILESKKGETIPYGLYNYSNDGEITWYQFAEEIRKQGMALGVIKNNCKVNPCSSEEYFALASRPAYSVLSKSKIKNILDCKHYDYKKSLSIYMNKLLYN